MAAPPRTRRARLAASTVSGLACLALLAGTAPARAAPRLALPPVRSDVRGEVAAQLAAALCGGDGGCAPGALGGGRLEAERLRRLGVDGALLGSLWRERGGLVLSLALFTGAAEPARTWVLPLSPARRLAAADLARLAREVGEALGGKAGASRTPAPPSTATASPAPTATSTATATATSTATSTSTSTATPTSTSTSTATSTPTPTPTATPTATPTPTPTPTATRPPRREPPPPRPRHSLLALDLGVEPGRLSLRFPDGGTAPVAYSVTLPAPASARLELRPFALSPGPLAGLGLLAEGAWLGGIALPSGARSHRATFTQWRAGLGWRLPLAGWLVATPELAVERETFVVGPADGIKVPGLPDARLEGGSAGLSLEAPLGGRVALLLAGRATRWLRARELAGGAGFYPGGSATGLAGEAGAAVRLGGPCSVRLLGTWSSTRWRLDADPSGAFTVRSAAAERWGGRAVLRLEW